MLGITEWIKEKPKMQATVKSRPQADPASFPMIEEMLEKALSRKPEPTKAQQDEAKAKSKSVVAGFPVFDPDKEREHLDKLIATRQKAIEEFITDRKHVRGKLELLGIKPLAIVPTKAWVRLCGDAGLICFQPDSSGKVAINRNAIRRYSSAKTVEAAANADYVRFVRTLLASERNPAATEWIVYPTVILPTPPQEIVDILVKARGLSPLKTAAVPEAIRFAETPTEIYNYAATDPKDIWARQQGYADYKDWVKRDPIVYHEHGTATAIIAQFGDFPIEKKVVEIVMDSDDLVPEKVGEALIASATNQGLLGLARGLVQATGIGQATIFGTSAMQMEYERQRVENEYRRMNLASQQRGFFA